MEWAARWFGDIVCEPRDKVGFIIGLVSVFLWALAEVPQLVVNAFEGSSDGLSEGLLWVWVFSDVLDVVGCSISDTVRLTLLLLPVVGDCLPSETISFSRIQLTCIHA